ncbi:MAG: hypothetical protein K1X67_13150 [Fimbriimonadaceae bacterium]|nr:hypothetical protein [Fimbriimonadaceae bacterium]
MKRFCILALASAVTASLAGFASAQADFFYGFEGLSNGNVFGQDGWGVQSAAKSDGVVVVDGGSPAGGGSKSLQLNPQGIATATRVWRNFNDATDITSGKWLMTFDAKMFTYAGSPSVLLRVRPDGRDNNFGLQVFQAGIYQSATFTQVPAFFTDVDGFGQPSPYQGLYWFDNTYGVMNNNNWYRVQYIMDYDANTITQELIWDINSGTPNYLQSAYDPLQTSPNGAFIGYFQSGELGYYDATGSVMVGIDDSATHLAADGGQVDNIGFTRLANVTGNISFDGYTGDVAARDCRITWRDASGATVFVNMFRCDSSGNYSIWAPTGSNLTAMVEMEPAFVVWTWLNKASGTVNLTSAGLSGLNFTLINGDSNRDNSVDIADYAALSASYGLGLGDTGYDATCDFNGDDAVDIGDYAILSGNYNASGD